MAPPITKKEKEGTYGVIITHLTFFLFYVLLAFVLLYPFYLRDHKPERYKGIWRAIGSLLGNNRYWVVWLLNLYLALSVSFVVTSFTQKSIGLIAGLLYFSFFSPIFLWYPFYLKEQKPEKYKGIWRRIGEWIGDPREAFPNLRKKQKR